MVSSRLRPLLALLFAFALVAAACTGDEDATTATDTGDDTTTVTPGTDDDDDDMTDDTAAPADGDQDFAGTSVSITGSERSEEEAGSLQDALNVLSERTGIDITFTGSADWESQINTQVAGGNPPDISIFPQPGKLADFARAGHIVPLPADVAAVSEENWSEDWRAYATVDDQLFATPVKSDVKSLVWFQPARFEENGYQVPESLNELLELTDQMIADGNTPWCVGIESGTATGWPFTDWVEDVVLRLHGPDVYDQWVENEIGFDDERIVEAFEWVNDLWNTPGAVYASGGSIAATSFQDNGRPLVEGQCMMHRQASFFTAFIPEGTAYADGSEGAVDVFYFPGTAEHGDPVLGGGTFAAAFRDAPEVWEVIRFMATAEYAEIRQQAQTDRLGGGLSGFLSAAQGQDPGVYQPIEQSFLQILTGADVFRFDASDMMPAEVGSGTFWSEGTSMVNGQISPQQAAERIEASWP
jgi:alpha-glucoside transport system substrate-binding protein